MPNIPVTNPQTPPPSQTPPSLQGFPSEELDVAGVLRNDNSSSLLALLFGAAAAALVGFLCVGMLTRQETVRGYVDVENGAARLITRHSGIVEQVWVAQGERLAKGQKLMTIRPEQSVSNGVSTVERQIADITAQVENNKAAIARLDMMIANAASERAAALESHANLLASLREQKSGLEAAVETQAATVAAVERNVKSGYARRDQLASEFKFLVDFRRQLGEVAARITEAASTSAARVAEIDQRRNGFANSRSELINQNHGLSSKLEEVRTYESIEITAPTDGTLVTLPVRAGSTIRAGQFVAAIADPNAPLRIVLEVPSKAVGLLRLGNRVNLKYDAFPFKTFGIQFGIVTRLSQAPLIAAAEAQSSSASSSQKIGEASFLVEVEPARTTIRAYGEERAVPVGSTLQADIVVERRRLLDWILDPVYAMKGRG